MTLPADQDTIVAIATGPGAGGVGIVRLSGNRAWSIASLLTDKTPEHRRSIFATLRDDAGEIIDEGLLLAFRGPRSFTGEDVAELHCHGGPVLLRQVVAICVAHGARPAEPGEFSQRAFLNGKIDLVQAEAIADLITSSTDAAARSASRTLAGAFSGLVNALFTELVQLRVFVEAAIDFPEEEIDFIADSDVDDRLSALRLRLDEVLTTARRGRRLRDGLKLVLAGAPNAGKSSLLNRLAEQDAAIVTNIAGTTRDVLREHIQIRGLPLHIVDTAGLRESGDEIEQEGIRRAREEMATADRILLVMDDTSAEARWPKEDLLRHYARDLPVGVPVTIVYNKIDASKRNPQLHEQEAMSDVSLSALQGDGIDLLREHLLRAVGMEDGASSDYSARERHIVALEACAAALERGQDQLRGNGDAELLAEDLRAAQDDLGRITGQFTSDDLLGEIFSSFCIGK